MDYEDLLYEIREDIAVITLNRPERLNALTPAMREGILQAILAADSDPEVRVIVLTGAGRGFCSGGDVKAMHEARSSGAVNILEDKISPVRDKAVMAMRNAKKPLIAAINGPAAGAGMNIALACDIRIAAETAFVSTGYARVGLSGDYGIAWLLTRLVGTAKARALLFTAERVDSAPCERLGIVIRVVPDESFRDDAFAFAKSLAEGPAVALRQMKDNLDDALTEPFLTALDGEAERLVETAQTADHKEAVRAFIEKRKPNFQGL